MKEFLKKPTTDFGAVRDGRQALPFYFDIDLTTARSIAAGTALKLDIAGNSFFTDADTTNGGNAIVHFQDVSLGNTSAPFFVSPGFIANVGFTQLLIENAAQTGKRMRIFYGVDIDFQAGVNASIAIGGTVSVGNNVQIANSYTQSYKSSTALAANTPEQVFSAAANVNGAVVSRLQAVTGTAVTYPLIAFIAKATAPANILDGDVIAQQDFYFSASGPVLSLKSETEIIIPAGKGLYFLSNVAETFALRLALYRFL